MLEYYYNLNGTSENYPPYNVIKNSEEEYQLEFAVAGFSKEDIRVYTEKGNLCVDVKKNSSDDEPVNYIKKGISQRSISKKFELAENAVVSSVTMKNGILKIVLKIILPDSEKKKEYEIGYTEKQNLNG